MKRDVWEVWGGCGEFIDLVGVSLIEWNRVLIIVYWKLIDGKIGGYLVFGYNEYLVFRLIVCFFLWWRIVRRCVSVFIGIEIDVKLWKCDFNLFLWEFWENLGV